MKSTNFYVVAMLFGACAVNAVMPPLMGPPFNVGKLVNDKMLNKLLADASDSYAKNKASLLDAQKKLEESAALVNLADLVIEDRTTTLAKSTYQNALDQANAQGLNVEECTQQANALEEKANALRGSVSECVELRKQRSEQLAQLMDQMNENLTNDLTSLQDQINECAGTVAIARPGPLSCAHQTKMSIIAKRIQFKEVNKGLENATMELNDSINTLPNCLDVNAVQDLSTEAQALGTSINNCIAEKLAAQEAEPSSDSNPEPETKDAEAAEPETKENNSS